MTDTRADGEYYMVHDEIWEQAVGNDEAFPDEHTHRAYLCIGCIEARLGRELTPQDFIACPINMYDHLHSDRLNDRIGETEWMLCYLTIYQHNIVEQDRSFAL
jgi:hypothetical protein